MATLDQRVRDLAGRLGLTIGYIAAAGFNHTAGRTIRLVVMHDMEYPERPDGAEWCARFFAGGTVKASAHYCVDNDSVVQGVNVDDVAWAAPGANSDGVQVEQSGYAAQARPDWLDPYSLATMHNAAKLTASLCIVLSIPARHLTVAEILAGEKGIVGHRDVNAAYHRSDHTDPGPNYPWDIFLGLVNGYIAQLNGAPASSSSRTITVRRGATLSAIAAALGITLAQLLGSNPQIHDPNVILPGDAVTVPPGVAVPPALDPGTTPPSTSPSTVPSTPPPATIPVPTNPAPKPSTSTPTGLHPGVNSAAVKRYQIALRAWLAQRIGWAAVNRINPHKATGYYGAETAALTRAAYRSLGKGWPAKQATPGRHLLRLIGILR